MITIGTPIVGTQSLYAAPQDLATLSQFADLPATETAPDGDGVLAVRQLSDADSAISGSAPNNVELVFFGTDADNETFDARVWLWRKAGGLYVPVWVCDVTCTLGNKAGVDGAAVTSAHRFADTITYSALPNSCEVISPAGDLVASLLIDARGAYAVQVQFKQGASSTAAAAGVLATQL